MRITRILLLAIRLLVRVAGHTSELTDHTYP
jgi:hypothetical protein